MIKRVFRVHRQLLKLLSYLGCVDVYDSNEASDDGEQISQVGAARNRSIGCREAGISWALLYRPWNKIRSCNWKYNRAQERSNGNRAPAWPIILYFLFSFHFIVNLYYQYLYDFDLMRLMKLQSIKRQPSTLEASMWPVMSNETRQLELELTKRMEDTKRTLDFIGAPFWHRSILVEIIYLCCLIINFVGYYCNYLYFRFVSPFVIHMIRESLNYEVEQQHMRQVIEEQVESFINSEKTFMDLQSLQPDDSKRFSQDSLKMTTMSVCNSLQTNCPRGAQFHLGNTN